MLLTTSHDYLEHAMIEQGCGMPPDYRRTVQDVVGALGTDSSRGLTEEDAHARLARYGPNQLAAERPVPAWRKFLAQFQDVLVIVLVMRPRFPPSYGCMNGIRRCRT